MLCRPAFVFGRDFGRTWSCACRGDGDGAGDDVREDEAAVDEEAAEPVRDGIGLDCEKPAVGWERRGIEGAGTGLGELSVAGGGCAAPDARGWLAVDEGDLRLARSRTIGKVGASSTGSGARTPTGFDFLTAYTTLNDSRDKTGDRGKAEVENCRGRLDCKPDSFTFSFNGC